MWRWLSYALDSSATPRGYGGHKTLDPVPHCFSSSTPSPRTDTRDTAMSRSRRGRRNYYAALYDRPPGQSSSHASANSATFSPLTTPQTTAS
jgi:hypothetical protein